MTIGNQIGQYRIVRLIGAGGMGAVYLGEHLLLARRAAIKTLLPERSRDPASAEWFFREARATSALSDPGVVQIYDFGYHVDGTAFIVMEYLTGETLAARIARLGRLPVAYALRIARKVASSLAVAHDAGIVHRDLKPANVFLIRDGEADGGERTKILDFGFCGGTPVYMSPEQCRRSEHVDHRSDIYALGCTLFQMIAGRPPFSFASADDYIAAHLEQAPEPPSALVDQVPPEVDALVLRCLAKDPDERFASMAELRAAIEQILPGIPEAAIAIDAGAAPSRAPLGDGFRSAYLAPSQISESAWFEDSVSSTREERRRPPLVQRVAIAVAAAAALGIVTIALAIALDRDDDRSATFVPPTIALPAPKPAPAPPPPAPPPPPVEQASLAPAPAPAPVEPVRVIARPRPPRRPAAPPREELYETR